MERYIREKASEGGPIHILEAGCGQMWPFELRGVPFTLTGVDLNEKQLERRRNRRNDLHEAIVGDLRYLDLEPGGYDVIYNSYVLEHISGAHQVLDNFAKWLKPSGVLILRIPDRDSVWGFVTRFTPNWFHVFYHKYIRGIRDTVCDDVGPYPTFHDAVVSRRGIHEYCAANHFIMREEHGHAYYLEGLGAVGVVLKIFVRCMSLLSLGTLAWKHSDLTYVLEKTSWGGRSLPARRRPPRAF
jgi:SAM-dependent methyltransferase